MRELSSRTSEGINLAQEDWEDLWKRLRLYTYSHFSWMASKIEGGLDLDEVIQEAIVDTITGKRHWPTNVKLVTFLCQVIRSKVSHVLEKQRKLQSIESTSDLSLITHNRSPGLSDSDPHHQAVYCQLCTKMLELVSGDPILSRIVELWATDPQMKPSEVARELGISIESMRNAQKRLSKRLARLRKEWRNV